VGYQKITPYGAFVQERGTFFVGYLQENEKEIRSCTLILTFAKPNSFIGNRWKKSLSTFVFKSLI